MEPPPSPPPLPPCLLASVLIHSARNSLSASLRASATLVAVWASPASKLSSVGTEVIIYVRARFSWPAEEVMRSGASNSTSARPTPPSCSPTPDSTRERSSGPTVRQVGHQEAVQKVSSGVRAELDAER